MSRFFGEIRQAGYVVDDIEKAMDYWSRELGIGPWFYNPRVPIVNYHYRGKAYEPHNSVALANSGPLQMELIQIRNDAPSMYADFLKAGHKGLQHVAYWTEDYDADLSRLEAEGFKPVMSGEVDFMFSSIVSVIAQVRQGRVRAIATTGLKRSPVAPEVPTMSESGVPGFVVTGFYVLLAPAAIPADILAKLNADAVKAVGSRAWISRARASARPTSPSLRM